MILLMLLVASINVMAQKYDGFVITAQDSLFKGYMLISVEGGGRRILITDNKKKKPRSFHTNDLKYYAYKKDTTAILKSFYPFEDETFQVEVMEAKVLISKGRLKLYYGILPQYKSDLVPIMVMGPSGHMMAAAGRTAYQTYIVKDEEGNLKAVRKEASKFYKSIDFILEKDKPLLEKIENKKLKFKHMKKIIETYNHEVH